VKSVIWRLPARLECPECAARRLCCQRIADHQRPAAVKYVFDLRKRDQCDEEQRQKSMEPPQTVPEQPTAACSEPERHHALGHQCADRGPPAGVPHVRPILQPYQSRCLEQVTRAADDHQDPEESPISRRYCGRSKSGIARRPVGPRVVELGQAHPTAPIHHVREAADEGDSGHVEYQREHQVELTVPEADSEQAARECRIPG